MVTLYFVYGLAFFVAGLLLAFQARLRIGPLSSRQLASLAAFALVHGLSEWAKMQQLAMPGESVAGSYVQLATLAVSFAFLMQFGVEVLSARARVPAWTRAVPAAILITFAVGVALERGDGSNVRVAARYVFGVPGALLAAYALVIVDRDQPKLEHIRKHPYLSLAAASFIVYGLVAGLVGPRATFFPASWLNAEAFREATGVPIEVLRAACAFLVALTLTEAFVVESAKEQARLERLRQEFISIVAHDLRSPLNAITVGVAALTRGIERGAGLDNDSARRVLGHLKSSGSSLTRMVSDLLDSSRIEAHRLTIEPETLTLSSFLAGVVARAAAATEGHPVETLLPESLPAVIADSTRLEQVLSNLLSNAAKYSPPGSPIRIEAAARDGEVEISVTNLGEGLTPQECANLFTRFHRSHTHRGRVPGLGLGLYIAKGLVEAQGGSIWVDSKPGERTTFAFTLPTSGLGSRARIRAASSSEDRGQSGSGSAP